MGESAGGGSIMHQITAYGGGNSTKAPFQQAIIQSGAFLPVPGMARQESIYEKFLRVAGVTTLDQARNLSTEELQFVNAKMVGESAYGDFTFSKCPFLFTRYYGYSSSNTQQILLLMEHSQPIYQASSS